MVEPPRTLFEMLVPRTKIPKDTTAPGVLSGLATAVEESWDRASFEAMIGREFANVHPDNPINKLCVRDKGRLLQLIATFDVVRDDPRHMKSEEQITKLVSDAVKMAGRFERASEEVSALNFFAGAKDECRELAAGLRKFARIAGALNGLGKPGHKQKISANGSLVSCSEFICLKTGSYHDEQFAELLQSREGSSPLKDLSGDAIRKKRDHLRQRYPSSYEVACSLAAELS